MFRMIADRETSMDGPIGERLRGRQGWIGQAVNAAGCVAQRDERTVPVERLELADVRDSIQAFDGFAGAEVRE